MTRGNTKAKQQVFAITAPDAANVLLVGDFTDWHQTPIPLKKGSRGVWHTAVQLPPGTHHYRFIVDGEWRHDPECPLNEPSVYGGQNSVREVRQ